MTTENDMIEETTAVDRKSREYLTKFHERKSLGKAIRHNCLECVGGSSNEVKECASTNCNLWPYRFGFDPWREVREMTEEERIAAVERLQNARDAQRQPQNTL